MAVTCIGKKKIYGHTNVIVFKVQTKIGAVYMSVNEAIYLSCRSVSIIDSELFVELWRASHYRLHRKLARGTPETWRKDYKFHEAEQGFSHGISNPVPLAEVSYTNTHNSSGIWPKLAGRGYQRGGELSFTNGITRTIWLLCNGAKSFPVVIEIGRDNEMSFPGDCEHLNRESH